MTMTQNDRKMTFAGYYHSIPSERPVAPKTAFVRKIATLCKVSEQTVRMWIQGVQEPDELKKEVISKDLGIPAETLFPHKEKNA